MSIQNQPLKDFLTLPFEVYYSDDVPVWQMEFMSDVTPESFYDVRVVHEERGSSTGVTFRCNKNNGPELLCCILNGHDEVDPPWLEMQDEASVDMNFGNDYKVVIKGSEIFFEDLSEEEVDPDSDEYLDVSSMDACCTYAFFHYELGESTPDYIVLDPDNRQVKVNLEGYVLDDEDNETEERLFDPDELQEDDELGDASTYELSEMKNAWVASVLAEDFPENQNLRFSE